MSKSLRKAIGLNGVATNEYKKAKRVAQYFEWLMFVIALMLPFYWYLTANNKLPNWAELIFSWFIWLSFTTELITLTSMVRNKRFYLKTNWFNIIIIIFTLPVNWLHTSFLVLFRLLRLLVLFRVLVPWWVRQKEILAKNHLFYTLVAFTSIVLIGGTLVSLFDTGIKNPISGIWWAIQTITTVGYGDIVPATLGGRLFAALIMVMGIALITILTANFSAYLTGKKEEETAKEQRELMKEQLQIIQKQIDTSNKRLAKIEKHLLSSQNPEP